MVDTLLIYITDSKSEPVNHPWHRVFVMREKLEVFAQKGENPQIVSPQWAHDPREEVGKSGIMRRKTERTTYTNPRNDVGGCENGANLMTR